MGNRAIPFRPVGWFAAAALPLGIFLVTAGVMSIRSPMGSIDISSGNEVFQARCARCHFLNPDVSTHHGPNLHDIGRTAAKRKPGQTAGEYLLESILDPGAFIAPSSRPGMPPNVVAGLSPDEIRNLVAFLANQGALAREDELMGLDIPDMRCQKSEREEVRLRDMQLAEEVLRDKGSCLRCHSVHDRPEHNVFAPRLFGAGLIDPEQLSESIVNPDKVVSPAYRGVNVILKSGKVVSGRLISRTEDRLVLFTRTKENEFVRLEVPLSDVEEGDGEPLIVESDVSLMPTGFDQILSRQEIEKVIALIKQLN